MIANYHTVLIAGQALLVSISSSLSACFSRRFASPECFWKSSVRGLHELHNNVQGLTFPWQTELLKVLAHSLRRIRPPYRSTGCICPSSEKTGLPTNIDPESSGSSGPILVIEHFIAFRIQLRSLFGLIGLVCIIRSNVRTIVFA